MSTRHHGGLFKLSLDRVDESKPHFLKGKGALGNVRLLAAAMNTRAKLVDTYGDKTCEVLRKEMEKEVTEAQVDALLAGEATPTTSRKSNKAYACCNNVFNLRRTSGGAYRDPLCRAHFVSTAAFFRHVLELLARQRGRCAISGILLRGRDGETWFTRASTRSTRA